ncbi:SO_0444 family Cu/Zn efflux transporter [Pseudoalteromonas xiamenensis]|uniref:SO_0444 family Cu/Zn efflux transporter n=1 Tax=Pseudoalteromonas xiamenensis TaxID=882626 RepID=A0A975DFY6_9GAMM|nr:SO_0444 family Cu/Zn efflux transporter [Pseudoalteromonas xiamenensis]QTH70849.1 SO_0444 family Cu/Zn efflux transporter [Pseudoalteromonas xiamenensis]
MDIILNFWHLFVLSAPWLLLGLFIAGVIHVFIPKDFLAKHLGKEGFWTTVKAAFIGAPMPLCSCGVIPAAIGLRRAGGSKSATTAFLVSTPETGVDSISVSYALLGPFMAVIRPIAAITSAIVAGILVGKESQLTPTADKASMSDTADASNKDTSCCSTKKNTCATSNVDKVSESESGTSSAKTPAHTACCEMKPEAMSEESKVCCSSEALQPHVMAKSKSSCCSASKVIEDVSQSSCCASGKEKVSPAKSSEGSCCGTNDQAEPNASLSAKLKQAIQYSSGKLLSDTMTWLLVGLFFAALIQTFIPPEFLGQWGNGILAMVVVILISIPMYICATASTPIAAGLLLAGVSPGAVLVFMLAGPATNVATIGVVANELGKRAVFAYLIGVIGVAIGFGFLTDYLIAEFGFSVVPVNAMEHEVLPMWLSVGSAMLLAGLMVRLMVRWQKKTA